MPNPPGVSRRDFLRYFAAGAAGAAGTAAAGWGLGAFWLAPDFYRRLRALKAWEIDYGVVDHDIVKEESWGPVELGFQNDIRRSPPEARVLNVAQWYDYWPGKVLNDFSAYMDRVWGVPGVKINWTSNIYTSNEELFTWITQQGRKFDLVFPTNYTVESLEKAGQLANMNKEWIPNYVNMFGRVPTTFPDRFESYRSEFRDPRDPPSWDVSAYPDAGNGYNNAARVDFRDPGLNGYAYRGNTETYPTQKAHPDGTAWGDADGLVAVPYQWGTAGIGYRTDIFRREDIKRLGWEIFELSEFQGISLSTKKMLLDDMREVFTAALKAAGWKRQKEFRELGLTTANPTAIPKNRGSTLPAGSSPSTYAESPFNGDFQWSANETDDSKLGAAVDWIRSLPGLWGFSTAQQGPFLVAGQMYVDQAWSGDIMYALRPASNLHVPIDYIVPVQGSTRWIDNAVLHRECERLWLAHEFINFLCDARVGATISNWNFYASPNAWSFDLLAKDPQYTFYGLFPDGAPGYIWNPTADQRIYADIALGIDGVPLEGGYLGNGGEPILERCEYHKDLGPAGGIYRSYWAQIRS